MAGRGGEEGDTSIYIHTHYIMHSFYVFYHVIYLLHLKYPLEFTEAIVKAVCQKLRHRSTLPACPPSCGLLKTDGRGFDNAYSNTHHGYFSAFYILCQRGFFSLSPQPP